jgi:polyphosphate glucokinase
MANLIATIAARAALRRQEGMLGGPAPSSGTPGTHTLAIDIGGSHLKAGVLDPSGKLVAGPKRVETPQPAAPAHVISELTALAGGLGPFHRVSVGFPGVVRNGKVLTAPNLGTPHWAGYDLAAALSSHFGAPVRLLNDASVQGFGVISGNGLECVITLGTGMGFALFRDGQLGPHLEMGQHMSRKGMTYDQYVGNAALEDVGDKRWNRRVAKVIDALDVLVNFDALLIGGGNARKIKFELPPRVRLVSNEAGLTGGVRLWDAKLETVVF